MFCRYVAVDLKCLEGYHSGGIAGGGVEGEFDIGGTFGSGSLEGRFSGHFVAVGITDGSAVGFLSVGILLHCM